MFSKAIDVVPELCWRILVFWYSKLVVYIKWGENISEAVQIYKGSRQGRLSSPFIFNLLYRDLVDILSTMNCGISISNMTYNLSCYADDLLLCSLSVPGLQTLIKDANDFITRHGLSFNPSKMKCVMFGQSSFQHKRWYLEGIRLEEDEHITHFGVIMANDARSHATARSKATRRAFYALQRAGLCVNGSNPDTITHIFKTVVRPVLVYGLECVYQTKTALHKAELLPKFTIIAGSKYSEYVQIS